MKKIMIIALSALLACSTTAYAGMFDEYNDYQNPDGTYSYYFMQGVTVTMDEEWYQNTRVIVDDFGAGFYHKDSYDAYQKEGYVGGWLFTIAASVNTDFRDLPSFAYIGFDEEEAMNYFAVFPTDVQAYMEDEEIRAEYQKLWAGVDDVVAGIKLDRETSGEEALFVRDYCEDDFSAELPTRWASWHMDDPDTLFASADGSGEPPVIFIQEVETDLNAGQYAVALMNEFLEDHGDSVAGEPEIITYEPADTDRKLAGFRGVYRSADGSRQYTELEYVEYFGDDIYRYSCTYLSGTTVEEEYEDETTYFEFHHAIDTMIVED